MNSQNGKGNSQLTLCQRLFSIGVKNSLLFSITGVIA